MENTFTYVVFNDDGADVTFRFIETEDGVNIDHKYYCDNNPILILFYKELNNLIDKNTNYEKLL